MVGVILNLQGRGNRLAGTAETFHDFHGPPDVHTPVRAIRVPCPGGRLPTGG
jgi:hypothetical protein